MIVLGLALVFGLAAAIGVQALRKQPAAPAIEMVPELYAKSELRRGELIEEAMVEIRQVPKAQFHSGALAKPEEAIARTAYIHMLPGDVVLDAKLFPKGSGSGMAALIKPGMRAFTIQTPSYSSSLAGFVLPGNRVDVLLTTDGPPKTPGDEDSGAETNTLLQNLEILAVHTTVETPAANKIDPNDARSVTLLVTPEQASILDLAQTKGTLHLSLRNFKDEENTKAKSVTLADLQLSRATKVQPVEIKKESPPPAPELPEIREVILPVRTLRGTYLGADRLTIRQSIPRRAKTQPVPPPPPRHNGRVAEASQDEPSHEANSTGRPG